MDFNPLGSSVHEISQARMLEWIAFSFSMGSSKPWDPTHISHTGRRVVYHWATREAWTSPWTLQFIMMKLTFSLSYSSVYSPSLCNTALQPYHLLQKQAERKTKGTKDKTGYFPIHPHLWQAIGLISFILLPNIFDIYFLLSSLIETTLPQACKAAWHRGKRVTS